jgi:short subunit dehydrogenase-like uncharacterized protein
MSPNAELDIVVYGASGFTGRLVAEYLAKRYGVGDGVRWAIAGRSQSKLAEVRDEIGVPKDVPLIMADGNDLDSLNRMCERTKAVVTTVGPYQLYGSGLVAVCAATGTDYLDLTGEPNWMAEMIGKHEAAAKRSGARICFSCGFDSIPFELGVFFVEEMARKKFGHTVTRVKGRVRGMDGGLSGGTAASGAATMAAIQKDPSLIALMMSPFALTPGYAGVDQPNGNEKTHDADVGSDVGPFMMAAINTKNVHRSNMLQGFRYGRDFQYDEMVMLRPGSGSDFVMPTGEGAPKPGEGPSKEERERGFYDIVFIGIDKDGSKVQASVKGDMDPGYGSTSKILAEAGICLVKDCPDVPGGIWVPGAAMGQKLIERLNANAGVTFREE